MMRFLNELIQRKKAELDLRPEVDDHVHRERTINLDALDSRKPAAPREANAVADFDRFAANGQPVRRTSAENAAFGSADYEDTVGVEDAGAEGTDAEEASRNVWGGFSASVDQIDFSNHYRRPTPVEPGADDTPVIAEMAAENDLVGDAGAPVSEDDIEDIDEVFADRQDAEASTDEDVPFESSPRSATDPADSDAGPEDAVSFDEADAWNEDLKGEEAATAPAVDEDDEMVTTDLAQDGEAGDMSAGSAEPVAARNSGLHIWDVDADDSENDAAAADLPPVAAAVSPQRAATSDNFDPTPAEPAAAPRSGRVRTRLLGFQRPDDAELDPFSRPSAHKESTGRLPFPVGWLVVEKGPGRGTYFALSDGVSKIGRGEDQPVQLDFGDTSISRDNHAVVAYDNEQRTFFLGHGGKANLVRLNGMPVLSTEAIGNGDRIRIGETTLLFVALCGPDFDWDDESARSGLDVAAG